LLQVVSFTCYLIQFPIIQFQQVELSIQLIERAL
jgi:hypothetical protein